MIIVVTEKIKGDLHTTIMSTWSAYHRSDDNQMRLIGPARSWLLGISVADFLLHVTDKSRTYVNITELLV